MNISVLLAPYRDGFTAAIAAAVADTLEGNGHTPPRFMIRTRKASIAAASGVLTGSCSGDRGRHRRGAQGPS